MTSGSELTPVDPAQLALLVAARYRESASSGSRQPLESRVEIVEDGGLPFVVRVLGAGASAARRRQAQNHRSVDTWSPAPRDARPGRGAVPAGAEERRASPFLPPYDPTLLVGALSPTHVALLNKYNIVDCHLLIVTRALEDQESPLTSGDLDAAHTCLSAIDGLVFYNSGPAAGASQRHKHLQLVPFPLGPGALRLPFERPIVAALAGGLERVPGLAFRHRLAPLRSRGKDVEGALAAYRGCVSTCGLDRREAERAVPYNLLMTRDWMLVVPRSAAACKTIEVNGLGFAGALVARGEEDLALVRDLGPLQVLRRVAVAA